jgi:YVTN family beta-propeller protein
MASSGRKLVEFRILGHLAAADGERSIALGGSRQRCLLALLLVARNQPVSTDALMEDLWGERPPDTAAKAVQVYVSQLRKLLGAERIETRGHAYLIHVAEGELDLDRFEALVARARAEEPAQAAATLREALALFQGEPLQDFAYEPWAQAEVSRLEELRLVALEQRLQADLDSGQHAAITAEVESLVREHPLREQLRAQLMLALYRSGRHPEALETYRQGRKALADELGLEPGPELRELEQQILRHDPELAARVAPRPMAQADPPRKPRRPGVVLLLAGAGLLVAAGIAFGIVELTTGGGSGKAFAAVPPDGVGAVDTKTSRIVAHVQVAGGPSLLTANAGIVWVASDSSRTVSSIAAETDAVTHVVAPGATPTALAADGRSVWVLDAVRRVLVKVDPTYGAVTRRIELPPAQALPVTNRRSSSANVALGQDALWVTDGSSRLLRIDTKSGEPKELDIGYPLDDVAVGLGSVWAISGQAASVFQVAAEGGRVVTRIRIVNRTGATAPFPVAVAVGEGAVWVVNGNTQTVSRIDAELGGVTATIPLGIGANPSAITTGAGSIWVANSGTGTLSRIDAGTNTPKTIPIGSSPAGVAVSGDRAWVTVQPGFRSRVSLPHGPGGGTDAHSLPLSVCSPVEFEGKGAPRFLIATDLPLQEPDALAETLQQSDAVRFVLTQRHFRAGAYTVGYQSCDDSTSAKGGYDARKCASNARAYSGNSAVVGVLGTYNSGCTLAEIPVLNRASNGPLTMISANSTYVGLTHTGSGTAPGEPGKYYPRGTRNFARVVAADDVQGAANAVLARELHVAKLYVVHDEEAYGFGIASSVRSVARKLGVPVVGFTRWDPHARDYSLLANRILRTGADAVFLGGSVESNGATLVRQLRQTLGRNVRILTPDGFTPIAPFARLAGPAAENVTVSFPARAPERLTGDAERFVARFGSEIGGPVEAYSVATAQSAEVLLDAIARSDGTRASINAEVFRTKVKNGLVGSFSIDRNGDTTAGAVTIYRIVQGKPVVEEVITPASSLVRK